MQPKVSIVIPALVLDQELEEYMRQAIDSIPPRPDVQLIIVDNGSVCGIARMAQEANVYIRKDVPIGYARAANIGLALADGEFLMVMNLDVRPIMSDWLDTFVREYTYAGDGVLCADDNGREGLWEESWYSLWMTDRRTFHALGYLDESLPYRFHDQAYSIECVRKGFVVRRTGAVQVIHREASTFKKMGLDTRDEEGEMIRRYGEAHFRDWRSAGGVPSTR